MKLIHMVVAAILKFLSQTKMGSKIRDFIKLRVITHLIRIKNGLQNESKETVIMLRTYARYSQGLASEKEMRIANEQFRDLLKTFGVGMLVILPFAPITLPAIVKLGKKFGIEIIPSSFRDDIKSENVDPDIKND